MFKELSKYVVIGIVAGGISYLIFTKESVSINIDESNDNKPTIIKYSYNDIYNSVKDSVVTINTDLGRGSGVIVTSKGHVVTNEHVIKGAKNIKVITAENMSYPAEIWVLTR